jgi:hypothetical protein
MSQRGGGLKVKKMMVCYKEEVEYYQSENPKSPMKKLFRLIPICTIFFVPRTFKKDDIYLFFDSEARDTRKKIIKGVNDHDDDDDWKNVDPVKKTAEMNKIIQLLLGIPDNTNFTITPPIATTNGISFKVPDPFNLGGNIDGPILENTYVLLSTSILNTNYCVYTGFVWYRNRSDESSLYFKDDLKMLTKHDIIYSEKKLDDIRKTASDIQTVILALEDKKVSGLENTPLTVLEEIKETNANISAYSEVAYSYLYQRRIQRDMNNS